jgi:hypothetical protein
MKHARLALAPAIVLALWLLAVPGASAASGTVALGPATNISEGNLLGQVAIGDFTGTSAPDLLAADENSQDVFLSAGNGTGGFGTPQPIQLAEGSDPQWVATGDLRRNGLTDAVVLGQDGNVYVLLQQPAPGRGLALGQTIAAGRAVAGIAVGDVNGDGIPDIVVGVSNGSFDVFYGKGDGTFVTTAQTVSFGDGPDGAQVLDVAVGDLNGDGKLDVSGITQADDDTDQVDIALQSTSDDVTPVSPGTVVSSPTPANFQSPTTIDVGGTAEFPTDLLLADLNGDGADDIVVSSDSYGGGSHGALVVLLNKHDGTGSFGSPSFYPTDLGPSQPVAVDLTGDGLPELAVPLNSGSIDILQGEGGGNFGSPISVTTDPNIVYGGLAAGDLNGDGRPDVVASGGGDVSMGGGVLSVLLNAASASAQTGAAVDVAGTTASLLGTIDGAGVDANYRFQYGPGASSTTYPSQTALVDGFDATGDTVEAADLSGLTPHTTYHYRIVVETSTGTVLAIGADRSFTTTAATSPTGTPGATGPAGPEGPEGPSGKNGRGAAQSNVTVGYLTMGSSSLTGLGQIKKPAASIPLTSIDLLTTNLANVGASGAGKAQLKLTTEEGFDDAKDLLASFFDRKVIHNATLTILRPGKGKHQTDLTMRLAGVVPTGMGLAATETGTQLETSFSLGGTITVSGGSSSTSKGIGWSVVLNKSNTSLPPIVASARRISPSATSALVRGAVRARVKGTRARVHAAKAGKGSRKLEVALLSSAGGSISADKTVPVTSASFVISSPATIGSSSSGAGAGKVTFNPLTLEFPEITKVSRAIAEDQRSGSQPTIALELPGSNGSKGTILKFELWATTSDELAPPQEKITVKYGALLWVVGTAVTGTANPIAWSVIKNKPVI